MEEQKTVTLEAYQQLKSQHDQLKNQLDWFKRQLFGRKSEKRIIEDDVDQGYLFSNNNPPLKNKQPTSTELVAGYTRGKKQRSDAVNDSGLRFNDQVPIKIIDVPCQELEGVHAEDYCVVSEKVSYRLAQRTGSYVILKYVRKVVKHKNTGSLITTPAPQQVFERSIADVSFLAGLLIDKFRYYLPLYRQHQRLAHSGIELSRRTLTTLTHRSINLLKPIVQAQQSHCLQSDVLAMDETPIKAGRAKKGHMHQGYFWPMYGDHDEVVFIYAPSRSGKLLDTVLEGFTGTLLTDGYSAYSRYAEKTTTITAANCWAHTRRYFEKSLGAEPEAAKQALTMIGELYQQEETIRQHQLTGIKKLTHRHKVSKPIVDQFWNWCDQQCQRLDLIPSNPLSQALTYAMKRKAALEVFLSDDQVAIDTNHLERALRPIPMGKKTGSSVGPKWEPKTLLPFKVY